MVKHRPRPTLELIEPVSWKKQKYYARLGFRVVIIPRPDFDTGLGPCGQYLCSCEGLCKNEDKPIMALKINF